MSKKIIIDADPGIVDALAVLTALLDPSLDVIGLTATAGSISGLQATRNLQLLTDLVDPLKHPRIGQCDRPAVLSRQAAEEVPTRHSFLGTHGLGDVEVNVPDLHNRRESTKLIVDLVREFPHEVRILTLGPLTNIAAACEMDAELPSLLDSIVCLGGADRVGGDITAAAPSFLTNFLWRDSLMAWTGKNARPRPRHRRLFSWQCGHASGGRFRALRRWRLHGSRCLPRNARRASGCR